MQARSLAALLLGTMCSAPRSNHRCMAHADLMPIQPSTPTDAYTKSTVDLVAAECDICPAWVYDWELGPSAFAYVADTKYCAACCFHRWMDRTTALGDVVIHNTVREKKKMLVAHS